MKKLNIIVMNLAGALLIAAAVMKMHQVLTQPILSKGFYESWLFLVIQIPLELGLGIWLTCGLFKKGGWLIGLLAYGTFIFATVHKVLTGADSCGCFGMVKVDPRITLFTLDIPFFLLLAIFRPRGEKLFPPPWPDRKHFFGVAVPTFVLLTSVTLVLAFNKVPRLSETFTVHKLKGKITKPEPNNVQPDIPEANAIESSNGEPDNHVEEPPEFDLLKDIDIADSLETGVVIILFHRHDCEDCAVLIPIYDQMSRDGINFAFIEIPPLGSDENSHIPDDTPCLVGKLDPEKDWPIQSPWVVALWDGVLWENWEEGQSPGSDEILNAVFPGD